MKNWFNSRPSEAEKIKIFFNHGELVEENVWVIRMKNLFNSWPSEAEKFKKFLQPW